MTQPTTQNFGKAVAYKKANEQYVANINLKENVSREGGQYKTLDISIDYNYLEAQIKEQKEKGYKKLYISCSIIRDAHIVVGNKQSVETVEVEAKEMNINEMPF
jgi:hypothetical protein